MKELQSANYSISSRLLSWFPQNIQAANLLLVLVLVAGVLSVVRTPMEVFPELDSGKIVVLIPYPGASCEEVEEGVCARVEQGLAGIEGIDRLSSVAQENLGTVMAHLQDDADSRQVLDQIQAAVDRIEGLPKDAEKPIVSELSNRTQVLSTVIYGDVPERTLKSLATRIQDDLTNLPNVSLIEQVGTRQFEVTIEVSELALRRFNLSFDDIAEAVRRSSLDLPGGSLKTAGGEMLIRTKGQLYTGGEFEGISVRTLSDGSELRLGQVATVIDGFEDADVLTFFDGKPAVALNIFRAAEQDALDVAAEVKQYVRDLQNQLPAGVSVDTCFDLSRYLKDRIALLLRNASIGALLVFCCLALFLDLRLAFWTTLGIPVAFLGGLWLLPHFDVTVNMFSLFAFIVVLGIVVDDAIVIGECIFAHRQRGLGAQAAAIRGVCEMAAPVTFAALTTIAAFVPLLYTSGELGKIVRTIPVVVISVLVFSLLEALFILPAHLAFVRDTPRLGWMARLQSRIRDAMRRLAEGPYAYLLRQAVRWRYLTVALALAVFAATLGVVVGGHIRFVYLPKIDSDNVVAELTMPHGTSFEQTRQVVRRLESAAQRVQQRLTSRRGPGQPLLIQHINSHVGRQPILEMAAASEGHDLVDGKFGAHLAEINMELLPGEHRGISSTEIANLWRREIGEIAGVSSLVFLSSYLSFGDPVHVQLEHRDMDQLLAAGNQLKGMLAQYQGVHDVKGSFQPGKPEIRLSMKSAGRRLGLKLVDVARQVRQGFYGEEIQRVQRDREDAKVIVRYPRRFRRGLSDLYDMRIRLPNGTEVPFLTVAEARVLPGYAVIRRSGGKRIISITAEVDETLANARQINRQLADRILPRLASAYPGLSYRFEGEKREQEKSLASLAMNGCLALAAIFVLLGIQFRSYSQPLIVMSAIPFGLIGAVVGHAVMGMELSFLSAFGVVALTGVVVNDSLIMIDTINRTRAAGLSLSESVQASGARRFRPILLTTLTTVAALVPMIVERSLQARWLVPMAVSLAFGIVFATAITLIFVPAMYVIIEDVKGKLGVGRNSLADHTSMRFAQSSLNPDEIKSTEELAGHVLEC